MFLLSDLKLKQMFFLSLFLVVLFLAMDWKKKKNDCAEVFAAVNKFQLKLNCDDLKKINFNLIPLGFLGCLFFLCTLSKRNEKRKCTHISTKTTRMASKINEMNIFWTEFCDGKSAFNSMSRTWRF